MNNKFCISGYYGFDNFGDEVILKVLIENLKKFKCQPEITVFSVNPEKTSKLYNVKSVHSFKYFEVINSLFRTDYLISGGGSLLQDSTSIKSIIYYLGVIFLAYLFNKKVLIFAQGIGSIHNKIIAKITALLLKKAQYITVRDENSFKLLQQWGIKASLCNDPAWNIEVEVCDNSISDIGIQLRPWASLSDSVLFELAQVVNKYFSDRRIKIFSLQNNLDLQICRRFDNFIKQINPNINTQVIENHSNEQIIKELSKLEMLMAMRYHACLIGIKSGVKVLPLSYDIKVENIAARFNLDCIKINLPEEFDIKTKLFKIGKIFYDKNLLASLSFDFSNFEEGLS